MPQKLPTQRVSSQKKRWNMAHQLFQIEEEAINMNKEESLEELMLRDESGELEELKKDQLDKLREETKLLQEEVELLQEKLEIRKQLFELEKQHEKLEKNNEKLKLREEYKLQLHEKLEKINEKHEKIDEKLKQISSVTKGIIDKEKTLKNALDKECIRLKE